MKKINRISKIDVISFESSQVDISVEKKTHFDKINISIDLIKSLLFSQMANHKHKTTNVGKIALK